MGERKRKAEARERAETPAPTLYEGLSKCLEGGHVSFASFPVQGAIGITKFHACSQCGLMFWEN